MGRTTEWSVIPLPMSPGEFNWPDMTAGDLGSRAKLKPGSHLWWYPAEVNTTILGGSQRFWARHKQPRTVTQLVDIFYTSVGRNGNLLLNLSPDKRGLVPDNQLEALSRTAEIGLFKQSVATLPPTISDRSTAGAVSLSNLAGYKMVYTVDGSAPTTDSAVCRARMEP